MQRVEQMAKGKSYPKGAVRRSLADPFTQQCQITIAYAIAEQPDKRVTFFGLHLYVLSNTVTPWSDAGTKA
jgi:hypothetical protein